MYTGDEDDELQRLLEGRDEDVRSPPRPKSSQPARKKQRVDDVVPEREEYNMDDFIVRDPDDDFDVDSDDEAGRPPGQYEAIEAPAKKTVRRVTLNPRPKLDPDRLKSAKGLVSLLDQHSKLTLRGPGHEVDDLNRIMFTLEHWGHLLFPKMAFDDLIERLEQLGSKKTVSVFVKKMRQGLPLEVPKETFDEEDEEDDIQRGLDFTVAQEPPVNAEEAFDRLFSAEVEHVPAEPVIAQSVSLTDEQRQEIARKRLAAMERRREREAREALEREDAASGSSQAQEEEDGAAVANDGVHDPSSQKELMDMLADAEME